MSSRLKAAVAAGLLIAGTGSSVSAAPFDAKVVAADAKWVMHVDVDALAKTQAWKLVEPKLTNNPNYVKAKHDIERVGQVKLPDDLHDVTLFGPSVGKKENAVVVIHANVNQERLKTLISLNETYTSEVVNGQSLHHWNDNGKQMYGGFSSDGRIVLGQGRELVVAALDTIAGKLDPLKNAALAPRQNNAGLLLYVAGDELAKLQESAKTPVLKQLQSAWITVMENDKGLALQSEIAANTEQAATTIKQWIDGVKAMVSFAGQDNPDALLVSDALLDLNSKADGKMVSIDWSVPTQTVSDLLDRATGEIEKQPQPMP